MATQEELLAEARRRGLAPRPSIDELRAEANRRGLTTPQDILETQPQEAITAPAPTIDLPAPTEDAGVLEQFGAGFSRGAQTIGRGLGLLEPETEEEKKRFEALGNDFFAASVGEIVGEALPFVPLAAIGPAVGVTSFIGRALIGTGLGALEGGVITRGKGAEEIETAIGAGIGGTIGGVAEALLPSFGRLVSRVFKKIGRAPKGQLITPEGTPTPEFQAALDETGTNFDDLTKEAVETLSRAAPGTVPEQAARQARFEAQGIPATTGDITQTMAAQTAEQRALSMATGEAGEPLRQLKLEQSEAFKRQVNQLVDSLGVPSETGTSLKAALEGRKKILTTQKNALYQEVADASPEAANFPILTDTIEDSLPDRKTLRRLSRIAGSQIEGVKDLLVEFGIDKSDEALEQFVKDGGEVTPLTLGNFDEFRQALGQLERADTTGATGVAIRGIRDALDNEAGLIDDAVQAAGITDESIVSTLKAARATVRTIKTEFSPQSITGRLIATKRDGVTPVIEASKAANELLKPTAPIENLQRTLQSLKDSGSVGSRAVGDLRASIILGALDAGLKAPSRKTAGIETIGGNQFAKFLNKFGDDKLELLFRGNEASLDTLNNLRQTALDITPAERATPKGSAAVILDLVNRFGSIPGLAAIRDVGNLVINAGADERAVRKAIKAKPEIIEQISKLRESFPGIVSALGVPVALELE
ncbi:MAG: hypothetical protein KAI73_05065 [Rhodospirillaceae bacterium]|nr:hypothetical protein [Rhodospirillaceae bacterium]